MTAPYFAPAQPAHAGDESYAVKPLAPGEGPQVREFGARPGVRFFCFGSDAYGQPAGRRTPNEPPDAFAAVSRDGSIVALGMIVVKDSAAGAGELTLAVHAAHDNNSVILDVLAPLAASARARVLARLVTAVPRERNDPFPLFRDAGLRTVSWFNIGGVTEVVLALD